MRVLLIGAGGVGAAAVGIAARRDFYDTFVVADYDLTRAIKATAGHDGFVASQVTLPRRKRWPRSAGNTRSPTS